MSGRAAPQWPSGPATKRSSETELEGRPKPYGVSVALCSRPSYYRMRMSESARFALVALLLGAAACGGGSTESAVPGMPTGATSAPGSQASTESVLHSFGGTDGAAPDDGMIAGKAGTFYGTTIFGGIGGGTVFKLTPQGTGYSESVVYDFKGGTDGMAPDGIVAGSDGAFYGVTFEGGNGNGGVGWGTIFKLTPQGSGYSESVLYRFNGFPDAGNPNGPIVIDRHGAIFGSSGFGGTQDAGAVFELTPSGSGYSESVVYSFSWNSGGNTPQAGLAIDRYGAIYGTTMYGGDDQGSCSGGCGTVFTLTPGESGYSERTIYAFTGRPDGDLPYGALTLDARTGAIFGTTYWGGTSGVGTVFKLTRKGSSYSDTVLHSFTGKADGFLPEGTLLLKAGGALYGTAALGGGGCAGIGCGTVFELLPSHSGYSFRVIEDFLRPIRGAEPEQTNLLTDSSGALYGTTRSGGQDTDCADGGPGGAKGCGVVFKIAPTQR
jgi:hypothetical protein